MKKFLNALLVLCLSFGLYACGDDGEGEGAAGGSAGGAGEGGAGGGGEDVALMCGDPACGGDLTGSWNLTEACTTPDAAEGFAEMCPEASQTAGETSVSGTIVFNEDGTFTRMSAFSGSATVNIPTSCLMGLTCDIISSFLTEAGGSCSAGAADSCDCTLTFEDEDTSGSGTYTIEGNTVTMVEPDDEGMDEATTLDFCARASSAVVVGTGDDVGTSFLLTR